MACVNKGPKQKPACKTLNARPVPGWRWPTMCMLPILLATTRLGAQVNTPQPALTIKLPAQVQVHHPLVLLGEVASLTTSDATTLRRLMALTLGHAPRAGESVILERASVARWIRSHTGLQDSDIAWQGASSTEISPHSRAVLGTDIARVAETALRKRLANQTPQARIELQLAVEPRDIVVLDDAIEISARTLDAVPMAPRMGVWIDILSGGQVLRTLHIPFDVAVYAPVSIATQDLPSGTTLATDNTLVREQNIAALSTSWRAVLPPSPVAQRVRRPLHAGEIVSSAHVESMPDVVRGSWAQLESRQGGMSVQSRAEVLQDGHMGQLVQVKPSNASTSVVARVTGPGRVEISP